MTSIEQSICEAISTIVDKSISEAGYDKTIQGKIAGTVDSTIGSYRVSYQDSTFLAYSTSTDVTYTTGSTVYVLIPSGDFSNDKTILGTVKKLGINYVSTAEGQEAYDINGVSVVTSTDTFELSSYGGTQAKVLYSKDSTSNLVSIDTTAIEQYIKTTESLICGMTVKTSIPTENQYRGNYGIIFALDFADNATGETVTRYYTVDVDKMTGNPYKLISATEQYGIFDIDYENFIEINYISLFCTDFPNESDDPEADIFISDIIMCAATALSSEDLSNYSLTFSTPQGTYFTSSNASTDTLTLVAQVRVKGKVIDNDSQELPYYWFTEHAGVNSTSLYYNKYGGQGWKCLNDYTVINSENNVVEWVAGSYKWTVKKSDVAAASVTYKCAVVYDGTVITKTITVKNLGSNYEITIGSDSGTQFYFDIGNPTLTCYVNGEENSNYTYSWAETTYDGTYSALSETTALNEDYNELYSNYTSLVAAIENGTKLAAANATTLASYEDTLLEYESVQRVEGNKIHKLQVSSITTWSTYTCTVYYGTLYLGTASIVILNSLETEGTYSLIINHGSHLYKYNEAGVSPASSAVDDPIDIEALTFTIYNNLGEAISDEVASHCSIQWIVPTTDTLITVPSAYTPTEKGDTTNTYSNITSFSYGIASRYDITKRNNDITLLVDYQGLSLSAVTDLTFVKEGESGTNGTEYTCRIVPNIASGTAPAYPIITQLSGGSWSLNYTTKNSNVWFKVQLWHSETKVFESATSGTSDEGITATVTWSILRNRYTSSVYDTTSLSVISSSAGTFTYSGYSSTHPANIVKVTVSYDGYEYYATIPVITVKLSNDNYRAVLKEGTGFQYATYTSDGESPKYDNAHPFEVTVTRYVNSYWEDVSTLTSSSYIMTYTWGYLGRVYESSWVVGSYLADGLDDDLERNQWSVKPASEFDGQCVTNAVECVIKRAGTEVARIHMPVHLLLNKYGLSYLNSWDGNSVTIDEEGGYILAPQVGAGIKNSDNSFTGVVIGAVKESGSSTTEVGLFGYAAGVRSIFLDADSGKAEFGAAGKGQIVIDPSNNKAQLYSGNYSTSAGTGMLIDLTTPEIKFGSGNFSVTADGYLTAKGGGSIAGFNIDDDSLYTGTKNSSSNVQISSADFTRTVNGTSDSTMRMAFSNNFGVNSSGKMYAASGVIGSGSNKITLDKSSGDDSCSAIYSGSKSSFDANATGFYIGTDGIALGYYSSGHSRFQVTNAGQMIATTGYIGNGSSGWSIQSTYLVNGDKTSYNDTSNSGVYIGTSGIGLGSNFYVSRSGVLHSSSGTIGGWTIGSSTLTGGNITLNSNGSISGGSSYSWSITSEGVATFNRLVASSSGTIGGWTIGSTYLMGGNVTLNSSGAISGSDWSITAAGQANFSNINVTGGTITLGGSTLSGSSGSTTLGSGTTYVGSESLSTYVKRLSVESLNVSGTLTFQGKACSWQSIKVITRRKMSWTNYSFQTIRRLTWHTDGDYLTDIDVDWTNHDDMAGDLSSTSYYRTLWILTAASDEAIDSND